MVCVYNIVIVEQSVWQIKVKRREMGREGQKEDMNKAKGKDKWCINYHYQCQNGHEKMGAFKSKSLWQPTKTQALWWKLLFKKIKKNKKNFDY